MGMHNKGMRALLPLFIDCIFLYLVAIEEL